MGPKGGDPIDMNLILAGVQSAYVDYIGMQIMGYTLQEVGHVDLYMKTEHIDRNDIRIAGETIESVKYNFKKVNLQAMREHALNIENNDACSSCMNALILSVMCAQGVDFSGKTVYVGSKFTHIDELSQKIAFGKCSIQHLQESDYNIRGCPPYPFELKKQLEQG